MDRMDKRIGKKELEAIISKLIKGYKVFAPVGEEGVKLYKEIKSVDQINWEEGNSHRSLKELFFPITEHIFSFRQTRKGVFLESIGNHNKKRVIIGARPCDCYALDILDNVFKWDYQDELYLSMRENTIIISLACSQPDPFCFCTAMKLSPFEEKGSDILLTEIEPDLFHARILSEKGKVLMEQFKEQFTDITPDQLEKREAKARQIISKMPKPLPIEDIKAWLDDNFDNPLWEKLGQGCIGCGTCAYLCPTCHCFDLVDEKTGYRGERRRNWDSCAFGQFTKMPSHQPRDLQWQRFRQRIMHKFKYFIDRFSQLACVGCGRCRALCPANKDIIDIVRSIKTQADLLKTKPESTNKGQ